MSTILVAALGFVVGAIAGAVALLAFAAWTTKDVEEIERTYEDWKHNRPSSELIEACSHLTHWRQLL